VGALLGAIFVDFPGELLAAALVPSGTLSPSIKISSKKILHGVLNSSFPQPDFFPQENLAVVFP